MESNIQNIEIYHWLRSKNYQYQYDDTQEYRMIFEIDMPKIFNDFLKYLGTEREFKPKRWVWQYKTLQMDEWKDATEQEYEKGKDLLRYDWRRVEK